MSSRHFPEDATVFIGCSVTVIRVREECIVSGRLPLRIIF
jgi:hypothetical protein